MDQNIYKIKFIVTSQKGKGVAGHKYTHELETAL